MEFEELVAGVRKHHGPFIGRIEGQKLLQVGDASRGAFAEWFRRQGREVHVDGSDKDYDASYSQGRLDGMTEEEIVKLVKKVLKRAPVFVFSVPTKLWRHKNVKRTPEGYERILSGHDVETFPYWAGRMLCVVVGKVKTEPVKIEEVKAEVAKTEEIKAEVVKTKPVKTEAVEENHFAEWKRE